MKPPCCSPPSPWLAAPALAFAHPGHGEHGLVAGLAHPLTGLDHLLAMFAAGLWAAQQQGAARPPCPTFVGTMLVGGLLGFEGLQLPFMAPASPPRCSPSASAWPSPCACRWRWRWPPPRCSPSWPTGSPTAWSRRPSPAPGCTRRVSSPPPPRCTPPATRWCASCRRRPRPWYVSPGWLLGAGSAPAGRLSRRASSAPADQQPFFSGVRGAGHGSAPASLVGQRQVVDGKGAGDPKRVQRRLALDARRRSASVLPPTSAAACRRPPAGPGARPARSSLADSTGPIRWRSKRTRWPASITWPSAAPWRSPDAPGPRLRTPPAPSLRPRVGR